MKQSDRKDSTARNMAGVAYGELIRNSRREKGMSQEELGALARVGKNAVGAWEAGRSRPDLSSVPVICNALGISVPEFFGIPEENAEGGLREKAADPEFDLFKDNIHILKKIWIIEVFKTQIKVINVIIYAFDFI